ncbi:thiol reductase thioredoxin [Planococcaceae bacterium Storch 2/2-2]|nr:thiol reductase thioredoxin [Planococcaceae bacterium Storch 2/2-2]
MISITTLEQFEEAIRQDKPALVKFQAGWCPDCTRLDMFIGPIQEQFDGYTWYDIDRDVLPEVAEAYDVRGIPSLLVFKDGEKTAHLHSAHAKTPDQVTEFLTSLER